MILDASAVMAVVLDQPGAEKVVARLGESIISAANYSEALTSMLSKGISASSAETILDELKLRIEPVTASHARAAAMMWPITKTAGLSLGDRICLALALERGEEILTSDRAWATVDHGAKVTLIR
jgi:ribonuclease VapC